LEAQPLAALSGREALPAGTPPAEAFKKLYYSHRASPLQKGLSLRPVQREALLIKSYGNSVLFKSNIKAVMQGERIRGYSIFFRKAASLMVASLIFAYYC
jgi:hypothetical protein